MKFIQTVPLLLCLTSCLYGINERTSSISTINYSCPDAQWDSILKDYSIDHIEDSTFSQMVYGFKSQPFQNKLVCFKEEPKEIIAVSQNYYSIRYVYNPNISNQVLDGYSKKLTPTEVTRISKRIYHLLEEYGCKENL